MRVILNNQNDRPYSGWVPYNSLPVGSRIQNDIGGSRGDQKEQLFLSPASQENLMPKRANVMHHKTFIENEEFLLRFTEATHQTRGVVG